MDYSPVQLRLESTIDSVVTQLIESNDEGRIKVEEMEHQNEIMRKEMDQLVRKRRDLFICGRFVYDDDNGNENEW